MITSFALARSSLLIDRGEDYFSHKTVNRPFQLILLKSCSIRKGFKADRLQMIVVAKKYICVVTVHQ